MLDFITNYLFLDHYFDYQIPVSTPFHEHVLFYQTNYSLNKNVYLIAKLFFHLKNDDGHHQCLLPPPVYKYYYLIYFAKFQWCCSCSLWILHQHRAPNFSTNLIISICIENVTHLFYTIYPCFLTISNSRISLLKWSFWNYFSSKNR